MNFIYSHLKTFVTFQWYQNFINPTWADSVWFHTSSYNNYLHMIITAHGKANCLCLSPVFIAKLNLLKAQCHWTANKQLIELIDCIFHSYEWERCSSFWCMVFGVDSLQGQLKGSAILIETKPSSATSTCSFCLKLYSYLLH